MLDERSVAQEARYLLRHLDQATVGREDLSIPRID